MYPQGGDIYHLVFQLQRAEKKKNILLITIFCTGLGILIICFRKCQNAHPMPGHPSPLWLDIDRCINLNAVMQLFLIVSIRFDVIGLKLVYN